MKSKSIIENQLMPVLRKALRELYDTEHANIFEEQYILEWKRRIEQCILGNERVIDNRGRKTKKDSKLDSETLTNFNQPDVDSWRKVTE